MKKTLLFLLSVLVCFGMANGQNKFAEFNKKESPITKIQQLKNNSESAYRFYQEMKQQPRLQYVKKVKKDDIPNDKAQVILEVHDPWGNPLIGYQMLMDETAQAYNEEFYVGEYNYAYYAWAGYSSLFTYTIPEGIASVNDPFVHDGAESILIPAGTYDYLIGAPDPFDVCVTYAHGDLATGDDFVFQGGYAYLFKVELEWIDGMGNVDMVHLEVEKDAAIEELILPANGLGLGNEDISIVIANKGTAAISGFAVSYQINDESAVTETYTNTIAAGEQASYTFTAKADFSTPGTYAVKATVALEGDLNLLNNSKEGECRHYIIRYTPFFYDFSSTKLFLQDWIIIDNNDDNSTWEHYDWLAGPDREMGAVSCPAWRSTDDYLISPPIYLEAGKNNVSFYTRIASAGTQNMNVLLGKSMDPTEFEMIGEVVSTNVAWRQKAYNFEVDESGVYYIAFHEVSTAGSSHYLDDVLVDAGEFPASPLLEIERILIPYPNCDFSAETRIGARLVNHGTGPTDNIKISYTIDGTGQTISETFKYELAVDESHDFYLSQTADFSALKSYNVTITAEAGDSNVSRSASTTHYEPLDVPFESHFQNNTNIEGYWAQLTEGTWEYESMGGRWATEAVGPENGLLLRCMTINNPFRIRIAYMGGGLWSDPSSMYIAYGKPGTDISTWEKIYEADGVTDERDLEFITHIDEPGEYSFIIVSTKAGTRLGLFYFYISEVFDYDIRITGVDYPLAPYTPAKQIPYEGSYTVRAENRGLKASTGIEASLIFEDAALGTSAQTISLDPDKTGSLVVSGAIPQANVGDELIISLNIVQNEVEQYDADNTWNIPTIHATESVLAMENVTEFVYGIGEYGGIYFGHIYTMSTTDILTSMSVGLAINDSYEYEMMGVAVYKMKAEGLSIDYELFSTSFERGAGGGVKEVPMESPILLTPGKYFFEVRQLESNNIGLAYEENNQVVAYQNINGLLMANPGGALAIRGNFALGATALEKDAEAVEFVKPKFTEAVYSSEEIVSANIKNTGSKEITDMEVICDVNGVKYTAQVSLRPYETKEVEFVIDMATPGDYEVTVTTALAGDENPGNNSITHTLISMEIAEPYFLNFELCNDFAIGREFNPLWWSVDRKDHEYVDAWWQYNYIYNEQPVGFIAYNRAATTPVMPETSIPGFIPYSGVRFGAAFAPGYGVEGDSDTWLISPKMALGKNSSLELYVKSNEKQYYNEEERYNLLISTTDDNFDSFVVLGEERRAPFDAWTKVEVDLNEYNNSDVYIAIQYLSQVLEGVVMMVDDIHVKTNLTAINQVRENDITAYYSRADQMIQIKSDIPIKAVNIRSVTGQTLYQATNLNTQYYRLSTIDYSTGVYLVSIHTDTGIKTIKFVISK